MDKQRKREKVKESSQYYFDNGYNCTQAVIMSVSQNLSSHKINDSVIKAAAGFTGGLGTGEICGAVIGGVMTAGLNNNNLNKNSGNKQAVKLAKEIQKRFLERYRTLNCRKLRDTRPPSYRKAHNFCREIVKDCAEITYSLME